MTEESWLKCDLTQAGDRTSTNKNRPIVGIFRPSRILSKVDLTLPDAHSKTASFLSRKSGSTSLSDRTETSPIL